MRCNNSDSQLTQGAGNFGLLLLATCKGLSWVSLYRFLCTNSFETKLRKDDKFSTIVRLSLLANS